jgi:hypothetical protein
MTEEQLRPCIVCGGAMIKGMMLDRDDFEDYQVCFAIQGDQAGYLSPSYPSQHPINVRACIHCGHLEMVVDVESVRKRLKELGKLDE